MRRLPMIAMLVLGQALVVWADAPGPEAAVWQATTQPAPPTDKPMFRTSVDLVSVAATVRDQKGRAVRDLTAKDFEVYVAGQRRPIVSFQTSDAGPISMALVIDVSGSMNTSGVSSVKQVVEHLVSWLDPSLDEAAVYSFDNAVYELEPFTHDIGRIRSAMERLETFGMTSIFDAVAGTARHLATRPAKRRAIVVITDGQDNASRLTPADVSAIASEIDVPVYVVAVLSPLDNPESKTAVVDEASAPVSTTLRSLAAWTGGDVFVVSGPANSSVAVRQLVAELRHQYLIGFEAAGDTGWNRLDVRTRRPKLTVRARGGYQRAG